LEFLKDDGRKALFIVDEHCAIFRGDTPVPIQFPVLSPLMNLNYWGENSKFSRVIFMGTTHAKENTYQMVINRNV
jgi:hypothetical protein